MRRILPFALSLGAVLWVGCGQPKPAPAKAPSAKSAVPSQDAAPDSTVPANLLFRSHFIGTQRLAEAGKATRFEAIRELPATGEMREQALAKGATAVAALLNPNANSTNAATLLRPLLEDLLAAESFIEARATDGGPVGWNVAVRLNKERLAVWETNLWQVVSSGGPPPASLKVDGHTGWARLAADGLFHFIRIGDWALLGSDRDAHAWIALANQIKTRGRLEGASTNALASVDANLSAVAKRLGIRATFPLPRVALTMTGQGEYIRTEGRLHYEQAPALNLEPWDIPVKTIQEPLISFTAMQGLGGWLKAQPWWGVLETKTTPNQLFVWAQSGVPFQTSFAAPFPNASNELTRLAVPLANVAISNLQGRYIGAPVFNTNRAALLWQGMPIVVPFVKPAPEPGGNHLLGGFFPTDAPPADPLPQELAAQVSGRTNLVYYDWEITEPRVAQWHQLFQVFAISSAGVPNIEMGPGQNWILAIAPKLGNTITEVTVVSPTELALTRRSHLGLTGFELALLSRWLDNAVFPRLPASFLDLGAPIVKPPAAP